MNHELQLHSETTNSSSVPTDQRAVGGSKRLAVVAHGGSRAGVDPPSFYRRANKTRIPPVGTLDCSLRHWPVGNVEPERVRGILFPLPGPTRLVWGARRQGINMAKMFTDHSLQIVTEAYLKAPWSGNSRNFRCGFCGHKFQLGEKWRAIYTNDMSGSGGNPLVCESCNDTQENLRALWKSKCEEWDKMTEGQWWWFAAYAYYPGD